MMRTLGVLIVMAVATSGGGWGQPAQDYESLKDATDDIWYAELLHAAQFTAEQLEALSGMQAAWQAETALTADVAAALAEVRDLVLAGTPSQEAYQALGERRQEVQQAQGSLDETARQLISELAGFLGKEQANALAWVSSPAHNLDWVVSALPDARTWPEAGWDQFKAQAAANLSAACAQADPGADTSPEAVAALLAAVRAMDEAQFQAERATLAQKWAAALLPGVHRLLQDEQYRGQRVSDLCRHLITYARGQDLVEAKLEAVEAQ